MGFAALAWPPVSGVSCASNFSAVRASASRLCLRADMAVVYVTLNQPNVQEIRGRIAADVISARSADFRLGQPAARFDARKKASALNHGWIGADLLPANWTA